MGPLLLAAVAGLLLLPVLPGLPSLPLLWSLTLLAGVVVGWRRWRVCSVLAVFLATFSWSVTAAHRALSAWPPAALEGVPLTVRGQIVDLPENTAYGQRLRFQPEMLLLSAPDLSLRGLWLLSAPLDVSHPQPAPDSYCVLSLRLKRPHGVANPGGFDYEAWLLSEGISATGRITAMNCEAPTRISVDGLRWRLRAHFQQRFASTASADVVLALVTGDRTLIPTVRWQRYVDTGVVHLMAISGMHITLLAALATALLALLLRCLPRLALYCPLRKPALAGGFVVAVLYSLVAGFSVPTERTLLMLGVVVLAYWRDSIQPAWQILALAALAVLLWSPLAVHAVGFWLSFTAVAILMLGGRERSLLPSWRTSLQMQMLMSLWLLPLTLWFFDRASVVSPLANLLAVPVVTFLVVPLGLASLCAWLLGASALADSGWQGAAWVMHWLDAVLQWLQSWPHAALGLSLPGVAALCWLTLALLCLWQPVQPQLRVLTPVFLLPLFLPPPALPAQALEITVLDVGQGLSVLLRTTGHRMLFDSGPVLGEEADSGQRYVVPALQHLGVYRLNLMLLSHDDNDHTGGAASILQRLPVQNGLGSLPFQPSPVLPPWQACRAGMSWNWDGWHFELLFPSEDDLAVARNDNDRSCVLRVSAQGQPAGNAVFLPGDLESDGEQRLLARLPEEQRRTTVLVAGHHGSRNASSPELLDTLQPQLVLVSAGYRNPFRHPSVAFLSRLSSRHIPWVNTAQEGALTVTLLPTGRPRLQSWRYDAGHYWQRQNGQP